MSAVDAFRQGDLEGALAALRDEVRSAPDDAKHRVFLFQLLAVQGDWDRALTQLNVARDLDPEATLMAQTYQELLHCEVLRQHVFSGKRSPMLFGEPEAWMAQALEALNHAAREDWEAANALRAEAWEQAPANPGTATLASASGEEDSGETVEFAWLADGDSRLGPLLEAVIDGRYYLIPFQRIQQIELEPPEDLRDVVWMPARFTWTNEGHTVGMIPTRYPGSESHPDADVRLAKRTEWEEPSPECWHGIGQRLFMTDGPEFGVMNLRKLEFAKPE